MSGKDKKNENCLQNFKIMSNGVKVFITGAKGFLGRNLAEYLTGKFDLLLPTHRELDLLDAKSVETFLRQNRVDAVIHTAAVGVVRGKNSDAASTNKNLQMFYNLANCRQYFGKMIFCGSGAVYDKRRDLVLVKEEEFGKRVPADPYGAYKFECSKFIESAENIVDLRLFGVYGKYEDYATRFISNAVCRALLSLPIIIVQDVKFEYLFVDDFAKVAEYFLNNPAKEKSYNVGTGQPVSLSELAAKIESIAGKKLDIAIKTPGWNREYTCDNSRLMREMPDLKFTPLDTSIKELYNWYEEHLSEIDKSKLLFDS